MPLGRITVHARQRMAQRAVTEAQIDQVLLNPDTAENDPDQGSVRLERRLPQGTLKVWVVAPWPPMGKIVVKSVAWKGQ